MTKPTRHDEIQAPGDGDTVDIQTIRDHIANECDCPYTAFLMRSVDMWREQLAMERGTSYWSGKGRS